MQDQISQLQLNKDLALAKFESGIDISEKVREYDAKIKELKGKLDEKIKILKRGIFASSPEEVRNISQNIIEAEVKNQSLQSTVNGLTTIVARYEAKFNKLPKTTIEFARFQRTRESSEKLFTLIEEKYQEALINEQSQPGNVLIIDNARVPSSPSKPNRSLMIIVGSFSRFSAWHLDLFLLEIILMKQLKHRKILRNKIRMYWHGYPNLKNLMVKVRTVLIS